MTVTIRQTIGQHNGQSDSVNIIDSSNIGTIVYGMPIVETVVPVPVPQMEYKVTNVYPHNGYDNKIELMKLNVSSESDTISISTHSYSTLQDNLYRIDVPERFAKIFGIYYPSIVVKLVELKRWPEETLNFIKIKVKSTKEFFEDNIWENKTKDSFFPKILNSTKNFLFPPFYSIKIDKKSIENHIKTIKKIPEVEDVRLILEKKRKYLLIKTRILKSNWKIEDKTIPVEVELGKYEIRIALQGDSKVSRDMSQGSDVKQILRQYISIRNLTPFVFYSRPNSTLHNYHLIHSPFCDKILVISREKVLSWTELMNDNEVKDKIKVWGDLCYGSGYYAASGFFNIRDYTNLVLIILDTLMSETDAGYHHFSDIFDLMTTQIPDRAKEIFNFQQQKSNVIDYSSIAPIIENNGDEYHGA